MSPRASAANSDANAKTSNTDFSELPPGEDAGFDWFDSTVDLKPEFVSGEVLVKFKESISVSLIKSLWTVGIKSIDQLIERFKVTWITRIFSKIYILKLPKDLDVLHVAREFRENPNVEYAEPNSIAHTFLVPNDANYTKQWAHQIIGSEEAWNVTRGDPNVVIAIVDSGVDYNHPDLAANIWNNTDEIPNNGIDDDHNGFIDDVRGWDFVDAPSPVYPGEDGTQPDNDPMDFLGHGTLCAGIVAAVANNSIGIAGVTWNCKIMPVRAGYAVYGGGSLLYDQAAAGIHYAADNGADIISMSFGGTYRSKVLYDAVKYAYDKGVLLVAAAGNNNWRMKTYPAAYEEVIAVTATDETDSPAYFTNFGNWVELAAPGVNILSTTSPTASKGPYELQYPYDYASGTSMAAPYVAGTAALILSRFPNMTRDQERAQLRRTAVNFSSEGFDIYYGYGRISASGAVEQAPAENDLIVLGWKLPFVSEPGGAESVAFYPSSYNLLGSTKYVSGSLTNLQSNNDVYMTFRSYASATSAQTLYAHQETTTIGGTPYYLQKLESADTAGTSLSASMAATGRQLCGKFVYPLMGVSSIPAGTWTMNYRAWRDTTPSIAFDAASSGNNGGGSTSISWSHTTGSGSNRIMIVGVSMRTTTVSVSSITYGTQSLTFIRADTHASATIRSELWYLIAPASGTATVTVTLSGTSKATGGSCTYTGVAQTSPLDANGGGTGTSSSPSQSVTVSTTNSWVLGHLAISGSGTTISSEGSGQTLRWDQATTGGAASTRNRGRGSDKGPVGTGSQSVSWTLSASADWAVSVVAFKPAPVGHVDVDILIRQSGGAIRTTIATNVANSADLTSTPTTLSGTYSWAAYAVVDQTDYLEIDYYVDVTTAQSGATAYLRIDDNSLALADQTRATNIYLPSEFSVEIEFTGSSTTQDWTQLVWTIDSSFTTDNVAATFQLFNYTANAYPTSGDGYMADTIGTTDVTKTQTITTNPKHFRGATGSWKVKVKGVKSTSLPFNWRGDLIKYEVTWPLFSVTTNVVNFGTATVTGINVKLLVNGAEVDSESITTLTSGQSATVITSWIPMNEGTYNVTTYVVPKNEFSNDTKNNVQFAYSWVKYGKAVNVPQDFLTIQEAIETTNLGIYGGDATIQVSQGTYYEYDLLIQNMLTSLTLAGENSRITAILGNPKLDGLVANADNVTIKGLTIQNSYTGVKLWAGNCIVSSSNLTKNSYGIVASGYDNNTIRDSTVSKNSRDGIRLTTSSGNTIINNTSSSNKYGLFLGTANKTLVSGNTIINNYYGIWLTDSSDDVIANNTLTGNTYGFGVHGSSLSQFMHDVATTNKVDGKTIYYLIGQSNMVIEPSNFPNVGYLGLVNSTSVTVKDLTLSKNIQGVMLAYTVNSNIQNVNTSNNTYGISFYNSSNTFFMNSTLTNDYYGVYTWMSTNNTITYNILSNDNYGFYLSRSSANNVRGNALTNIPRGINVYSSNNNTLEGNTVSISSTYGIYLEASNNNSLKGNTVTNSTYGIYLYNSESSVLTNNNMTENKYNFFVEGVSIAQYIHYIDNSNKVKGKPMYYLINKANMVIEPSAFPQMGYLGLINSTKIRVENVTLPTNNGQGILFAYVTNSTIRNVSASNNYDDIYLLNSNKTSVSGSTLLENVYGISARNSHNNTFDGNVITEIDMNGIYLQSSSGNTISGNVITEIGRDGIYLQSSSGNTISGNTVSKCSRTGSYSGIIVDNSGNNIIGGNTISYNSWGVRLNSWGNNTVGDNSIVYNTLGIFLWYSNFGNIIHGNTIANNSEGFHIVVSSGNIIYHNNIMNNTRQVYNSASSSSWDNGAEGNYWSDYKGQDLDGNGLGDTPYVIDSSNRDRYPFMKRWGVYALSLRVMDWDLTDSIQDAYVYVGSNVRISDANGWANWTEISDRTVYVKVKWHGGWVNGTFLVVVDSNKTVDIRSNIFDIIVTTLEAEQGAVLQNVNITVYDATGGLIRTGVTDSNGKVYLTNVPNSTLTFTAYEGSSSQHVIGNATRTITVESQAETIICDQNYVSTSQEWSIMADYNTFSLILVPFSLNWVTLPVFYPEESFSILRCLRINIGLKERVKTIRSKQVKRRREKGGEKR